MNYQPKHDLETGDLRGDVETVARADYIDMGDLPNADTPTDDLRGHEPPPVTDPETTNVRMIVGAVVVAALIGGIGISYATGMWNSVPATPVHRVAATDNVLPALPALAPQPAAVTPAASLEAPPPVEAARVPAHIAKPFVAPSRMPVVQAQPKPVLTPPVAASPEIIAPANTSLTAAPMEPVQTLPATPAAEPAPPATPVQPATAPPVQSP